MTTKKHDGPHFVMVTDPVLDAPAWRAMSHGARSLYIALKRRYWPNRKNNGHIYLPQRQAAKELGSNITEIVRWFRELQCYGFIVMMTPGCLGVEGKGRAPRWRLTEVAYMRGTSSKGTEDMPTMDFLKWDGVRFSRHQSGGDQPKPKTKSRSGKRERTAPENGSTHAPENGSTCHNYRSGKREQVNGLSAPENGSKSINHLGGREGALLPSPEDEPAAKKPWSTPTVEEIPWDTLPTELRMLVVGLPDPEGYYARTARAQTEEAYQAAATKKQPDAAAAAAAAAVSDQAETRSKPPAHPERAPVDHYAPGGLMDHVGGVIEVRLHHLDAKWAAAKAAGPVTPTNQEDEMPKPWEAEGMSRATWYRKRAAETVPETGETGETGTASYVSQTTGETTGETGTVPETGETGAVSHASHAAGETVPPRNDLASQIMSALGNVDEKQKQDAEKYLPKWSAYSQEKGLSVTQQARLIRELRDREVLSVTSAQVTLVGGKIIYFSQLGA